MFGYVRPLRDELKCRDFDLYRAVYCGLCAAMRRRYGWLAPMFLNYDFTFLALLLAPPEESFSPCRGRCHANPLRKKTMYQPTPALDTAADESVVLTWWQLRDRARDDRGWKGWTALLLARLLRPSYRRAASRRPDFDRKVEEQLRRLDELRQRGVPPWTGRRTPSRSCSGRPLPPAGRRAGTGLWSSCFITWAGGSICWTPRTTWRRTRTAGRYNPVAARFGPEGDRDAMARTLDHSRNLMYSGGPAG